MQRAARHAACSSARRRRPHAPSQQTRRPMANLVDPDRHASPPCRRIATRAHGAGTLGVLNMCTRPRSPPGPAAPVGGLASCGCAWHAHCLWDVAAVFVLIAHQGPRARRPCKCSIMLKVHHQTTLLIHQVSQLPKMPGSHLCRPALDQPRGQIACWQQELVSCTPL